MSEITRELLIGIIAGSASDVDKLIAAGQRKILSLWPTIGDTTVDEKTVKRVINSVLDGHCSISSAQKWASFIRRGYVGSVNDGGTTPVEIEFGGDDQLVADLLGRMDDFEDIVDGYPSRDELRRMIEKR